MSPALPPLNWFRAFEASARNLSFTAAGEEIGMTQSAVSQQVKSLEMRLGVPLFERKARGLALTDHGRRLLPQVDAALGTLSAATGTFFTNKPKDLLTISASISVIEWVIAPLLPDFTTAHPEIAVRFIGSVWPDEFSRTAADIEIRFGSRKQAGPEAKLLGSDKLIALKSPSLEGSIEDLPLIEAVGISSGWKHRDDGNETAGRTPALFVDSYGLALQLAMHGNGICLVHELLAGHPLQRGLIEKIGKNKVTANESYFLSDKANSPSSKAFSKWIISSASDLLQATVN
ncbi:MAG: LysR family transcriptional regulator [Roseibium sp.]|uniref:LysR family transcriptional regulator n=1 Tax=Roseibium sp. TaxID=1936156 RepID=UPI002617B8AD|nr:LysR family transcriptional regulator [Roseibium sp.]MCV0427175.1 LysR family transcriptional regulator [Roseibium sp.]